MHVELVDHVDALDRDAGCRDHARSPRRPAAAHALLERWRIEASSIRLTVCTRSWRRSASTQPSADVMPGKRGTRAHFRPICADQRADMQRAAAAERHGDELRPDRARARSRPGGLRRPCAHRRRARWRRRHRRRRGRAARRRGSAIARCAASTSSDLSSPPSGRARIDAAEHDLRIGQGRARRCPGRSRRVPAPSPRSPGRPASRPPRSTEAIEPPPAPMVVISTIGVRMTRPKSIVVCAAIAALPLGDQRTHRTRCRRDRR